MTELAKRTIWITAPIVIGGALNLFGVELPAWPFVVFLVSVLLYHLALGDQENARLRQRIAELEAERRDQT